MMSGQNSQPNTFKKYFASCIVPMCKSTSVTTPDKLFIRVPTDRKRRSEWMKACGRTATKISPYSTVYCCEDHFNLQEDMENWMKYRMMGGRIYMKSGVVPHIFDCQSEIENLSVSKVEETERRPNTTSTCSGVEGDVISIKEESLEEEEEIDLLEPIVHVNMDELEDSADEMPSDPLITESGCLAKLGTRSQAASQAPQQWSCELCGRTFATLSLLSAHMHIHSKAVSNKDSDGRKSFRVTVTPSGHLAKVKERQQYPCELCGALLAQKSSLVKHVRLHTGERRYACQLCERRFATSCLLRIHTRTHTNERPYMCSLCNWRFYDPATLKRHVRTHTGERPYACHICGVQFARKDNCNTHVRLHSHK